MVVLAVGAVVVRGDDVLLVRRANPPGAGLLTLPGGRPLAGESLVAALRREIREETGLSIEPIRFLEAVRVGQYVILDYLARDDGGTPVAGDDAIEAIFAPIRELERLGVTEAVARVVRAAMELPQP